MLLVPRTGNPLEDLARRIRLAAAPNAALVRDIANACPRFGVLKRIGKVKQFDAWCESGARVEVALALLANELPGWSVRRIVKDDDLWFCALSHAASMPIEFDDVAEASHENMQLVILLSLVEAKCRMVAARTVARPIERAARADVHRINCDNLA